MDFSEPRAFEIMRAVRKHDASCLLIAITALQHGLDVTFFRSQAEAGVRLPLMPAEVTTPNFYAVSDGRRRHYFNATQSDRVSRSTADITRNKVATKALLHRKNINTAVGGLVSAQRPHLLFDLARAGVRRFVMKPVEGSQGKGTFLNRTAEQAVEVLRLNPAVEYVVEQHIAGREHRVFVVDDRVVAAYWYDPPHVTGDGQRTVRALFAEHQAVRAGNPFVVDRKIDPATIDLALLMQKSGWEEVPAPGRQVWLMTDPFPDAQGEVPVLTDSLPDEMRRMALATARAVASKACAIDLMVNGQGEAFVLEVNIRPMIGVHSFPAPYGAWNLDVPFAMLRSLFPIARDPVREVAVLDFPALKAEVFRPDRTGRGVMAREFATFA